MRNLWNHDRELSVRSALRAGPSAPASSTVSRRAFLGVLTAATVGTLADGASLEASVAQGPSRLKLGFDNFSLRAMNWKAPELLDYAARLKLDYLLLSDLDALGSLEDTHLKEIKARADELGVRIHAGTWSICSSSKAFKNKWGAAEEHLATGIRVAQALGSPVLRCVMGTGEDRQPPGQIDRCITETVKTLRSCRSRALDAGVKIAVENHAGDLQARELAALIEAAGKEFVGVTLDAGNATWTMEHPLASLQVLAPYVVSSGIRDSMVWEYEAGAKVQWTAMGEGLVDWIRYFEQFAALCLGAPVILEIISGFAHPLPYLKDDFWKAWPDFRAAEFSQFLALARRGRALEPHRSPNPEAERRYQRDELERSLAYCRNTLGIGSRA